jgi:hypothetical protein
MYYYINGVSLNIIAYLLLMIGCILRITKKLENQRIGLLNIILLGWSIFFTFYLMSNYNSILTNPINKILNFNEIVTNFLFSIYIFHRYFKDKKTNPKHYHD